MLARSVRQPLPRARGCSVIRAFRSWCRRRVEGETQAVLQEGMVVYGEVVVLDLGKILAHPGGKLLMSAPVAGPEEQQDHGARCRQVERRHAVGHVAEHQCSLPVTHVVAAPFRLGWFRRAFGDGLESVCGVRGQARMSQMTLLATANGM
jgi:hypothetical protein